MILSQNSAIIKGTAPGLSRAALLCLTLFLAGLPYAGAAQAGETITFPGNGVLHDITIGMDKFSTSLGPSSSSPSGNSVVLNGGTVGSHVFGGYSESSDVTGNTVIMNGGSVVNDINAGKSISGNVTGNNLVINGGNVGVDVYGGYTNTGVARGNSVTINGGSVGGIVYGGKTDHGNAENNSVTINGGNIGKNVAGGQSFNGNVMGNSVRINGGSVEASVFGGEAAAGQGSATGAGATTNNSVTMTGGSVVLDVIGGHSYTNSSAGNSVRISGGSVGRNVVGGNSDSGIASGNSVTISGGSIGGSVNGGQTIGGSAVNNTVTILGNPVFDASSELRGGYSSGAGASTDISAGNTLNFFTRGISVSNIANFQHHNFALFSGNGTGLNLTGAAADFGGRASTISVPYAFSGTAMNVGHVVNLLHTSTGMSNVPTAWNGQTGQSRQGVSLLYDYTLSTAANDINATVTGVQVAPESKVISESRAASMGFANMGADLIAGSGLANARAASAAKSAGLSAGSASDSWGLVPFFALSASSLRYNTGSHSDVNGVALMAGLAKKWELSAADVLVGAFFEAAFGGTKSHNSFGSFSADGKGDSKTVGGGILARMDLTDTMFKGLYAEASFRIGNLTSDYRNDDLPDLMGNAAAYDNQSTYYGAHAGLGYIWNFNENAALDIYGKYFWTHQTGQDVTVSGDKFSFKDMDSHRVKLGGRFSYAVTETLSPYVGAAWEYEFDGKARATTYGFDVPTASLKGSTGVGEVGLTWQPAKATGFSVDLGAQGYTGQREGISGNLQLKYEF